MTTQEEVSAALIAWRAAWDRAAREHEAWVLLWTSYQTLIAGAAGADVSIAVARSELEKYAQAHSGALQAALTAMDNRYAEYLSVAEQYEAELGRLPKTVPFKLDGGGLT